MDLEKKLETISNLESTVHRSSMHSRKATTTEAEVTYNNQKEPVNNPVCECGSLTSELFKMKLQFEEMMKKKDEKISSLKNNILEIK